MPYNGYAYAVVAVLNELNYQFKNNIDMKNESNNNPQTEAIPYDSMLGTGDTRQNRIMIVNEIIKEIALRGREFFLNKKDADMAYIFEKAGRLFMHNEYNKSKMFLHTKYGYPPKNWHHGGTMWGLVNDFKEFIVDGGSTNHNNGYGGLLCPHWGYPESDMKAIQEKARDLGYLQ